MRNIVFTLLFIAAVMSITACINNKNSSSALDKKKNQELLISNVVGQYAGDLPCTDCEAINTLLLVNKDRSFQLVYTYVGKSTDRFVKGGNWRLDKNNLVLDGIDYSYKIVDGILWQLDLAGNDITGDLAEKYKLEKLR